MIVNKNNYSIDLFHNARLVSAEAFVDHQTEREIHLKKSIESVKNSGSILEFGVYQGTTINIISNFFQNDTVYGFDSFEGLPEDWITVKNSKKVHWHKGFFSVDKIPVVNSNVVLIKGWFENTLPDWVTNNSGPIKFLHIDSDLYSSAKCILDNLNNYIISGTIIVFDDFYFWQKPNRYTEWSQGEFKALQEWITDNNRSFEILHRSRHFQCCIKIL
jgi:hypothetical protein